MSKLRKTKFIGVAGWLVSLVLLVVQLHAQDIPPAPNPPKLVNDFANLLTPDQVIHLEQKLVAYDNQTSVQVVLVTMKTLNGAGADDFAIELGKQWGVGNKKTNNGVVLLVSMEPGRRRVFIAPGYGLEANLTDYTCKTIVDAEIIPRFKEDNYYRGIENGVDAIIKATKGAYEAPDGYANRGQGEGSGGMGIVILIIILILFFIIVGGRGGRGGGGDAMTRRGHRHVDRIPPFIFFPPIGGGGGGGGGGWSGGGGFGGFGGGGFGGGGAGGSW